MAIISSTYIDVVLRIEISDRINRISHTWQDSSIFRNIGSGTIPSATFAKVDLAIATFVYEYG